MFVAASALLLLCPATAEDEPAFHVTLSYAAMTYDSDLELAKGSAAYLRVDHELTGELRVGLSYLLSDTEATGSGLPDIDVDYEQWTVWVSWVRPLEPYPRWFLKLSGGLGMVTFDAGAPIDDERELAPTVETALIYRPWGRFHVTFGAMYILVPTEFNSDDRTVTHNFGLFFGLGYNF